MRINDIFLCRCNLGIKVKNEEGKIVLKNLPKSELCLSANGVYYGLLDFKKYLTVSECDKLEEECVVLAMRLDESALKDESKQSLKKNKEALLHRLNNEKKRMDSITDYLQTLPNIDLVWCQKGKVTEKNGKKGIIPLPEETCVALLYKGNYYDLINGTAIERLNYQADLGEVVAYSFVSVEPEELGDDYKDRVLLASLLLAKLEKDDDMPKVFYLR